MVLRKKLPRKTGRRKPARRGRTRSGSDGMSTFNTWRLLLLVPIVLLGIGFKLACGGTVLKNEGDDFKRQAMQQMNDLPDPEYLKFLIDQFHEQGLQAALVSGAGTKLDHYDPDRYTNKMVELILAQIRQPNPTLVGQFRQKYGRDPTIVAKPSG